MVTREEEVKQISQLIWNAQLDSVYEYQVQGPRYEDRDNDYQMYLPQILTESTGRFRVDAENIEKLKQQIINNRIDPKIKKLQSSTSMILQLNNLDNDMTVSFVRNYFRNEANTKKEKFKTRKMRRVGKDVIVFLKLLARERARKETMSNSRDFIKNKTKVREIFEC